MIAINQMLNYGARPFFLYPYVRDSTTWRDLLDFIFLSGDDCMQ